MNPHRQSISIASLVITITILLSAMPASASPWGMTGWAYRKNHTINAATNAGTNYQVQVTVHYGPGTDATGDIFCNNHCRIDFSDIRFTASDGSTLLDYWMQSSVSSDNAIFWVEVSADLGSSAQSIFIYYGNAGATSISSGPNTFISYEDGSSTINFTMSDISGTTIGTQSTVGNPVNGFFASQKGTASTQYYMYKNAGVAPYTFTSFNVYTAANNLGNFYFLCDVNGAGQMYRIDSRGLANYTGFGTTARWSGGTNPWNAPTSGPLSSAITWYKFGIAITSASSATLYFDATTNTNPVPGTLLPGTSTYTVANNGGYFGLGGDAAGGTSSIKTFWDNIITRKYVSPEPAHAAWSIETQPMSISTTTTAATCNGKATGTATINNIRGGASPFTYSWNSTPPQSNSTATGLAAGTYTVTVTDNYGLTATTSAIVSEPAAVTSSVISKSNISCFLQDNGIITIEGSNGFTSYQFSIDNGTNYTAGSNPYPFGGLSANVQYKIRVMDDHGCESPAILP